MEQMSIFADTSAFYALLDADDENYGPSARAWRAMMASEEHVVTTNYVLVETFALLQSRLGLRAVREFQEDVVPVLHVEFVTPETHRLGAVALLAASKRGLSLVDCVSFEVMRESGVKSAFTFDGHFREYGFTAVP
jgi:predicted nucleic acid-binding protein